MNDTTAPLLRMDGVAYGFPERPDFLQPLRAEFRAGECWGIIGPNGAGKSTLLRLMAGLRKPTGGRLLFDGEDLRAVSPRDRARRIALLPQQPDSDFSLSVADVVLLGRFPHRQFGLFESSADREVANRAMDMTRTRAFSCRRLSTLSGGEAQRVHLAAALAQEPAMLLLDEPTASLDWQHQLAIFELIRNVADQSRTLVAVVTHDLNLAGRFCTHILLLDDGRCVAAGEPDAVLTPAQIEQVYHVRVDLAVAVSSGERVLLPISESLDGESVVR
ncbi:MAG: ABC transporter ATP-binding protein [Phycisphaerae bacterium]|nr:ABC transporter ATP-binding protein [Phycisphaerae bacterium]